MYFTNNLFLKIFNVNNFNYLKILKTNNLFFNKYQESV